jgi:hypothetical protein
MVKGRISQTRNSPRSTSISIYKALHWRHCVEIFTFGSLHHTCGMRGLSLLLSCLIC